MSDGRDSVEAPAGKAPRGSRVAGSLFALRRLDQRLAGIAGVCAVGGALLVVIVGGAVHGCRSSRRLDDLERRVGHVEM